ncbi:MAG: hypothetical protein ACE5HE_13430, partial [Phycisphaerae bacterium]
MVTSSCHLCGLRRVVIGLILVACIAVAGCGMTLRSTSAESVMFLADCGNAASMPRSALDVVVLDWTGGTSPIYPGQYLPGLDLTAFPTADGGTLADDAELFKELVRSEIARIYCDRPEVAVVVANGEEHEPADTIVHITQ